MPRLLQITSKAGQNIVFVHARSKGLVWERDGEPQIYINRYLPYVHDPIHVLSGGVDPSVIARRVECAIRLLEEAGFIIKAPKKPDFVNVTD